MTGFDAAAFGRRFTHRRAAARGVDIHYVEGGRGDTVLLVPGWPQSWYAWRHVMPLLADEYRVIAIDPPGMGGSGPPAAYDTATVAAHVDDFLAALEIDRVHFVGHDVGAWIGYAYAARHADKVRRLALIDAAIPGIAPSDAYALTPERVERAWHFYFNALPELPEALVAGRERRYLAWLFSARSVNKAGIDADAITEYTRAYSAPGAMQSGFAYYRAIFKSIEQNRATAARKLPMPVLAIGGAQWLGPMMEAMVAPVADSVRAETVANCGHFVPEEAPGPVAVLLRAFLRGR